ncbi:hypothetical protein CRENBAI_008809 [Crenichthys baileyi]|uniref:Uncharacterized protein n=1 Tax=Crenichthys baileyi TaxID=28760 RepID=A0AAV9RG98_9TELE
MWIRPVNRSAAVVSKGSCSVPKLQSTMTYFLSVFETNQPCWGLDELPREKQTFLRKNSLLIKKTNSLFCLATWADHLEVFIIVFKIRALTANSAKKILEIYAGENMY